jgi:hypothetical protein
VLKTERPFLVPFAGSPAIPVEVTDTLKKNLVNIGKTASDMTLSMTYLDPDHTRAQSIGTYLSDNFTSRLEENFANKKFPELRATKKGKQFRMCIDCGGIHYSFPVHRCGADYVPKGGTRLKKDVRSQELQLSMVRVQPLGLFIGVIYHEESGLIEMFLGHLVPLRYKTKYRANVLDMIYCRGGDVVEKGKMADHVIEEVMPPVVKLRKK